VQQALFERSTMLSGKQGLASADEDLDHDDGDLQLVDQSFETVEDNDMESLLPQATNENDAANTSEQVEEPPSTTPLEAHMNSTMGMDGMENGADGSSTTSHFMGWIMPYPVGNMQILFPEFFHSSGWGVLGPHWFGPACVLLILAGASHLCIKSIYRHHLGTMSTIICYLFFGLCTYRLTDVSFRDPGICLDKEIPGHVDPNQVNQYRFCERCQVWQPPDGIHCPECNVCVAGYDHHCVWMGTCIGKRNYRQFVLFNMSWLYYVGYLFFWILTFGPLIMGRSA